MSQTTIEVLEDILKETQKNNKLLQKLVDQRSIDEEDAELAYLRFVKNMERDIKGTSLERVKKELKIK